MLRNLRYFKCMGINHSKDKKRYTLAIPEPLHKSLEEIADNLVSNGFLSLDGVSASELNDLTGIDGIDDEIAAEILQYVNEKKLS